MAPVAPNAVENGEKSVYDDPLVRENICRQEWMAHHEERLRSASHQVLPRTDDGGRKVLLLCPHCWSLWLQVGRGAAHVRWTDEQESAAVTALRWADAD